MVGQCRRISHLFCGPATGPEHRLFGAESVRKIFWGVRAWESAEHGEREARAGVGVGLDQKRVLCHAGSLVRELQ